MFADIVIVGRIEYTDLIFKINQLYDAHAPSRAIPDVLPCCQNAHLF
jgi:hypothetical protein